MFLVLAFRSEVRKPYRSRAYTPVALPSSGHKKRNLICGGARGSTLDYVSVRGGETNFYGLA
jgi:hypothetical protein